MKNLIIILLSVFLGLSLQAQELSCSVKVIEPKNLGNDPHIYQTLEAAINEFMNARKWTEDTYLQHEKIKCSIIINITGIPSDGTFEAEFIVQSERPVFNSSYSSRLFTFNDKDASFSYVEYQSLEYSDNTYNNNLTSLLAYYSYMIIGYDYDSYELNGGDPYFKKAQSLINNIPTNEKSKYKGWSHLDGTRNRFVLTDNMLNPRYKNFRMMMYQYNRSGLDIMYNNMPTAMAVFNGALVILDKLNDDNPSLYVLKVFFLAKSEELINIYSKASNADKGKAASLLPKLDPTNAERYQALTKM